MSERHDAGAAGNPFALEAFLRFCESKPAEEAYPYDDECNCAVGQFVRHIGGHYDKSTDLYVVDGAEYATNSDSDEAPALAILLAGETNGTFGALSARLRAALAKAAKP